MADKTSRNASKDGFKAEKDYAKILSKYCDIPQYYYRKFKTLKIEDKKDENNKPVFDEYGKNVKNYEWITKTSKSFLLRYKMHNLCTSLKYQVGGISMTENDVNLTLIPENKFIPYFTKPLYGVDFFENVAIQSKLYSGKVNTERIKHDVTNLLITPKVSNCLLNNSVILSNEVSNEHSKKLKNFGVKILSPDKFKRVYDTVLEMGNNIISFDKYFEGNFIDHSIHLGELRMVKSGFKNINFINYIDLDSITKNHLKKKISTVDEKLETLIMGFNAQITYLNHEYYIYSTKNGKIDREGREFLEDTNSTEATYTEVKDSFDKGLFFKDYGRIDHAPYAIKDIIIGNAKWEMLDRVKEGLREKGVKTSHLSIQKAIDALVYA